MSETPQSVHAWANGLWPDRPIHKALMKLFEEIGEFIKDPNAGEWADVEILWWDLALLHGIDPQSAVDSKMAINRVRTWAANPKTGVMQHHVDTSSVHDGRAVPDVGG